MSHSSSHDLGQRSISHEQSHRMARSPAGPGEAWYEEELVDLETAIAAYTIDVAYLNFQEEQLGSIEVGKLADLIVLDRNLFEIPRHEIHEAKVLLTLLEGDQVYHDASWIW